MMKKFIWIVILAIVLVVAGILVAHANNASWYGPGFHGRLTASGERFNMHDMTCASKTAKFGTILHLRNVKNGKTATCRVNDRGPYVKGRSIDVSKAVAEKLGFTGTAQLSIR